MIDGKPISATSQPEELSTLITAFRSLRPAIVTLDGPAGSGKSTVGHQLADLVNFLFFDTGVMYRAVTWAALQRGIATQDQVRISELAAHLPIDVMPAAVQETDGRQCTVIVDGIDITTQLRTLEVDQNVSIVSAYGVVRQTLSGKQRHLSQYYGSGQAEKDGIVMAGRDIGTVVVPEAPWKIYLDATSNERARRRYEEMREQGKNAELNTVLKAILQRDDLDSHREVSPLHPADDAIVIDTSSLSPEAVVRQILSLAYQVISQKK
ncbi:MAG: (d)CMP kinase [Chloroflexi bacterium]|nr:(d)CMP kinase [Chloroflexota bacterium]